MSMPGGLTPAEHLAHAHAHTMAAGQHADLAATHIQAFHDGDNDASSDGDGNDGDRAMPAVPVPPQSGYAQNRTGFAAGTGAARAFRAATNRR